MRSVLSLGYQPSSRPAHCFVAAMRSSVLMNQARNASRSASGIARAFRTSARACATPMSPLEPNNSLEPAYEAIEQRLSVVRKK